MKSELAEQRLQEIAELRKRIEDLKEHINRLKECIHINFEVISNKDSEIDKLKDKLSKDNQTAEIKELKAVIKKKDNHIKILIVFVILAIILL